MVTWKFKKFDADPQKVYEELQNLGIDCTPENIVEYAKDENSELHKCFTWDDTVAAEKWRKFEARQIVCNIVYTKSEENQEPSRIRAFYKDDEAEQYISTKFIVRDKNQYERLLDQALTELRAFKQKYASLSELSEILALID